MKHKPSHGSQPAHPHHHPATLPPDDDDDGSMPIEPDQGPVPTDIPQDPEHDRLVDPED